jgi:hypothetical protein
VDGAGDEQLPPTVDHECRRSLVRDDGAGLGQLVHICVTGSERDDSNTN